MPQFTVYLPGGGSTRVNASNAQAALGNVGGGGSLSAPSSPAPRSSVSNVQAQPVATAAGGGPTYQTVNGPKTLAQMESELRAAGWPGPTPGTEGAGAIANAYARTAGGAVNEIAGQSYGATAQNNPTILQQGGQQAGGQIGSSLNDLLKALATGNQAAAQEAARQFNATFGLDQNKFQEAVSEYNKNFGLAQAGLTGTYNGQQTLAAQKQAADIALQAAGLTGLYNGQQTLAAQQQQAQLTGMVNGAPTEQAREFNAANALQKAGLMGFDANGQPTQAAKEFAQQEQQREILQQAQLSGMYNGNPTEQAREFNVGATQEALRTIASAQNDPFRQMEVQYGANGRGLLGGLGGVGGANAAPKFGVLNGTAQNTGVLGMARQSLNNIPGGVGNDANSPNPGMWQTTNGGSVNNDAFSPNPGGMTTANPGLTQGGIATNLLGKFRTPTDVIARNYITADKNTQNMITSAISRTTGLDQGSVDEQIKSQLPKNAGPAFGLASI